MGKAVAEQGGKQTVYPGFGIQDVHLCFGT